MPPHLLFGTPLGFGINIGWSAGGSTGVYGEVGYRVGGTGFGAGATASQSLDYGFGTNSWSTTTGIGAYGSLGMFNAGGNGSYTYNMKSGQGGFDWSVSAGINLLGTDVFGLGLNIGYGSGGWNFGLGGFINPERPKIYKSPISDNYGNQNGECALRCLEEFSSSYGMVQYDYDYWFKENGKKLGVHAKKLEGLIDNTGVFSSEPIIPQTDIKILALEFNKGHRVLMVFLWE